MYEFASEKCGYNIIKINSYDNFCSLFWKKTEYMMRGWYHIFRVYYFENEWIEWNIDDYSEQIYFAYVNKFIIQ